MNTSVAAVGPNMNGAVPWIRFSSSHTSTAAGSSVCAAPIRVARSRRTGLKSRATTSSIPRSASAASAISPIGPHPKTATVSPGTTSDWFTACIPTASGSASAAVVSGMPSGTRNRRRPVAASGTRSSGVSPPSVPPVPIVPVPRSDGHTITRSPTATSGTSSPTHSTTPAISWPSGIGRPGFRPMWT